MKAEDIKKWFETRDRNVVFVFEEDAMARDEIRRFDLGPDAEILEYKGDAFAVKYKIRTLPKEKRLVVLVADRSPLASLARVGEWPLLGELMANGEYKAESPISFMSAKGMNTDDAALVAMVARHFSELRTAKAETVFAGQPGHGYTTEIVARGLISARFGASEMLEWHNIFVRLLICDFEFKNSPAAETKSSFLFGQAYDDVLGEVQKRCRWSFSTEGRQPTGAEIGERGFFSGVAERLKYNAVTRPLPVSATDPYASLKETDAVRLDRMDGFLRWAVESLQGKQRQKFFAALEGLAVRVKDRTIVGAYGPTAAYGFMTSGMSAEVLRALAASGFGTQPSEKAAAAERVEKSPIVCQDIAALARAEAAMARFYDVRSKIATFALNTREDFVSAYTSGWWRLDREYRLALENYAAVQNDEWRVILESAKDTFETDAQEVFNAMNLPWSECIGEAGGTAGIGGVTAQEEFYAKKKDPSVKVAVVVSDALRYEVALEVMDRLNAERGSVTMEAGIARLPTETKYTKAALLPHSSVEFMLEQPLGLDGGKSAVTTADRQKVLQAHFADGLCVTAKELSGKTQAEKRDIFKRKLVYVFHDAIDENGHGGLTGQALATRCREAVDDLVSLVRNIQNTCNVNHLWLVADHGFLICDREIPEAEKILVEDAEDAREKTPRYYFTQKGDSVHGVVKVAVQDGWFAAMPAGTRRFKANGDYTFVHGGASLQEVVIPMMHSRLLGTDATKNREKVGVTILGSILQVQSSRLKFELLQNEAVSAEVQERTVCCALFGDSGPVSNEVDVKLDSTSGSPDDRRRTVELVLNGSAPGLLTLKVFAEGDSLNPLATKPVTNNTLIEQDNW